MKPHVYAHRGGRLWAPENSLDAFVKSVDAGVYGIELDVHRLPSGDLIVTHDRPGEGISYPFLSDVLRFVAGRVVLNIEVKNAPVAYPGIERDILHALRDYPRKDRIIFSSFDHELLRAFRRSDRSYRTAILTNGILADVGSYARKVGASALHPQFGNLRGDHVEAAQSAGLEVNSWTLNTEQEWTSAWEMGLDGIVTDDPLGCMAFLETLPDRPRVSRRRRKWSIRWPQFLGAGRHS